MNLASAITQHRKLSVSIRVSNALVEIMTKNNLGSSRFISLYSWQVHPLRKSGHEPGRNLEAETGAAMGGCCLLGC